MSTLGTVYQVQPMAPDEAHTTWLDAGPLRVGVEYRELDPEALAAYYTDDEDRREIDEHSPDAGFTDQGLSLHVESVADDHEYLRFDLFDDDPHYHYVDKAAGTNTVVGFDRAAHGDMLVWVLDHLGGQLVPMLERAGAAHVVPTLAPDAGDQLVGLITDHLRGLGLVEGG